MSVNKKIVDIIYVGSFFETLRDNVLAKMQEGWQPFGSLAHVSETRLFIQPMVKYGKN